MRGPATTLTVWLRELVRATVLTYRSAKGEGLQETDCYRRARKTYVAASGTPESAPYEVMLMVAAAARDHPDWFWKPLEERLAREECFWRSRGIWSPPKNRAEWPPIPADT